MHTYTVTIYYMLVLIRPFKGIFVNNFNKLNASEFLFFEPP